MAHNTIADVFSLRYINHKELEMIDLILGPLFRINPLKYAFSAQYRKKHKKETGRESKFVFVYQVIFFLSFILVLFLLSLE